MIFQTKKSVFLQQQKYHIKTFFKQKTTNMSGIAKYTDQLTPGKNEGVVAITVRKALLDRHVYFYGQLCNHDLVKSTIAGAAASPESKTLYQVLRLLTYGVWKDLAKADAAVKAFVQESHELSAKLRQLTLLTVAERSKTIPYSVLVDELGLAGTSQDKASDESSVTRTLEDTVIDSTTAGLLTVTLNPQQRTVQVHDAAARDVDLQEVPHLLNLFESWGKRCGDVLNQLSEAQKTANEHEKAETYRLFQMLETEMNERRKALRTYVETGVKMRDIA